MDTRSLLTTAPVIPVIMIDDLDAAIPMAKALVAGGLPVLEVTLRTPPAMEAMRAMAAEVEGAIVGAGTVLTPQQLADVEEAGAKFAVSPGATPTLLDAAKDSSVALLPGAATASEAMLLLEHGYSCQKFFPAEPAGGQHYLKALSSPLAGISFCPTGGITPSSAPAYLNLPNVLCVGGSWVTPKDAVSAGDWDRIEHLARDASTLGGNS